MNKAKTVKTGTDFIREYDQAHADAPASELVEAGKKQGHKFGLSLVYEVRRRQRMAADLAGKIESGAAQFKPVYVPKRHRTIRVGAPKAPSGKDFFGETYKVIRERMRVQYRKQLVEIVSQLGLVDVKEMMAQIESFR